MDGLSTNAAYRAITVTPTSPHVGAEIGNIDLTHPLTDLQVAELRRAFTDHLVLFFRDQKISFDDHARLAEYFGPVGQHVGVKTKSQTTDDPRVRKFHFDETTPKVSGESWHTDQSCAATPPLPVQMACLFTHRRLQDPKIRIFMDHVSGRVASAVAAAEAKATEDAAEQSAGNC